MVFEEIFRYSPRRRASPWIAEGFSPTARGAYRIKFSNLHMSRLNFSGAAGRVAGEQAPALTMTPT
jgi:hypothetical protein